MSGSLVPLVSALLVFILVVYIATAIVRYRADAQKRRSLAMVAGYATVDVHQALAQVERERSVTYALLNGLGERLVNEKARKRLGSQLLHAGDTRAEAVGETVVRKVEFGLLGLLLGLLMGVMSGGLWWLSVIGFALVGFYLPDLLAYNKALNRTEEITKRLPDALDMLTLCVESGLSFQAALAQVATNQTGPVADEFAITLQEMQVGRSRGQALEALAGRTPQADVQRFVSAMLQVDKLGVPVATVLREQAREMRAKRYARAREQAQKVPVKILMPLMLCFLPALFIIILAPAVASIAQVFGSQ
jgi:tight adherence protein C